MTAAGPAYTYRAVVVDVHDGDSLRVDVDLGFRTWIRRQPIRLRGCNTRELGQPGGHEARDHLRGLLPAGTVVVIATVAVDKYGGRWDATVTLPDGRDLTGVLVDAGWAAPWDAAGARPVPPWPRP